MNLIIILGKIVGFVALACGAGSLAGLYQHNTDVKIDERTK